MSLFALILERDFHGSYPKFHDRLVGHPSIKDWWHYMLSCYILKTDWSPNQLSKHCTKCLRKASCRDTHLVLSVNLERHQGLLPKDAWDWIKETIVKEGTI